MSTFQLPEDPTVKVQLPSNLNKEQLLGFPAFRTWIATLTHNLALQSRESHAFHAEPYKLRSIEVQAADWFGPTKLGFVKLKAEVTNDNKEKRESLPGSVFLRGGSVAMLLVLQPDDVPADTEQEKQAVLTVQPRIPAGSLAFTEIPAGMLDNGTVAGAAMKEIEEETGLVVKEAELVNLSDLAAASETAGDEKLSAAIYPSPGGSDEFIPIFAVTKRVPRKELKGWEGKLTGLRKDGEKITLKLCPLKDLWKVGVKDGKTLAAWALYNGLRDEGKLKGKM